jgi:putative ABC transport system substrate-binding protein
MRRREVFPLFIAATVWPLVARAQNSGNLPIIGFLGATAPSIAPDRTAAFVQRLSELGWNDGRTIKIEYQWAEGRDERAVQLAAEFVRHRVDIIVTSGVPAILAAKQATSEIPIVFAVAADPVGAGLVASLANPGGNVTGLSNQSADLAGKRLQLLRELIPTLRRVAIIANVANSDGALETHDVEAASRALGLEVKNLPVRKTEDIEPALGSLGGLVDALYVVADPLINTNRVRIQIRALAARLPTIYNSREFVEVGGLISYGPNFPDLWRRAAELVDKILRGARPANIPVEQPTKFDLTINMITARALGLTAPTGLLARADQVVE